MERQYRSAPHRRMDGWRRARLPVAAASLAGVEWLLVGVAGAPQRLLRTLGHLGDAWTDPVTAMLALMALVAEALVAYVLVVMALRSLSLLPGSVGRLAGRVTFLVSPVLVRRMLDLLVGGTLLAQASLVATPGPQPLPEPTAVPVASATSSTCTGSLAPARSSTCTGSLGPAMARGPGPSSLQATGSRAPWDGNQPAEARPTPRRSAAPLPPWLGGGPSNTAAGYTVEPGDTLWDIAAASGLPPLR